MKTFVTFLITVFCISQLMADASIDATQKKKTILLEAPGTLSGGISSKNNDTMKEERKNPRYRYADDLYGKQVQKIPQFGQQYGRQNPWTQQPNDPNIRPNMMPGQNGSPAYTNPWHLGGPQPDMGYSQMPPYPPQSNAYGYDSFGGMNSMYPDYMNGIYRDTNPAAISPLMNGLLPGGGGYGFPFSNFSGPFSPFGMF